MKVKQLIEQLSKLNPDIDVLCYSEDEELVAKGHVFRLLDIEDVDQVQAERCRGKDDIPTLNLGRGDKSEMLATLNVTATFR